MRNGLLHTLGDRRHPRLRRRATRRPHVVAERTPDPAVQRVREAGGPVDEACYTCQCGYLFVASVSTTVDCPHCGAEQAW